MERIGRYTIMRKIGSGGMAEVFLARSQWAHGTEKLLVIKKIHPALAQNAKFIGMFVDEARVAMRLNHTNIVQVYTFEQIGNDYVLAMEYVDGYDLLALQTHARKVGERIPFGSAAFIAAEAAKGLDYAHSCLDDRGEPLDIVHRDISPQNILVSRDGAVKVADFGIARARSLHGDPEKSISGKFEYMAPEQAAGKKVDCRSDVFALGIVLYEMLIGQSLVRFKPGDDPFAVLQKTVYLPPIQINSSIPKELSAVVDKAIAKDPLERYQSARKMASDLVRYLHLQQEIYDVRAIENWISAIAPSSTEPAEYIDSATTVKKTIPNRNSPKYPAIRLADAAIEQQDLGFSVF